MFNNSKYFESNCKSFTFGPKDKVLQKIKFILKDPTIQEATILKGQARAMVDHTSRKGYLILKKILGNSI